MDFIDELKQFTLRVNEVKESITTEEATKMSLVVPFFQLLGYDVFNPAEFCPEYTADVGIKKGEKVDYAILIENEPVILIECKWCGEDLNKHSSQLFRYFGTSKAKIGILTNGLVYKFYTDLDEVNKMDLTPFFELDLTDMKDFMYTEVKRYCRDSFDKERIISSAAELKYTKAIKEYLQDELDSPSDEFVKYILSNIYDGQKTQKVIDKFVPIVKKSLTSFINEILNQKLKTALDGSNDQEDEDEDKEDKIITTQEEMEAFYVIRAILSGLVNTSRITFRDTESYFGIFVDDNNRKPICRIHFNGKKKYITIPDIQKNYIRYDIEKASEVAKYMEQLSDVLQRYQ